MNCNQKLFVDKITGLRYMIGVDTELKDPDSIIHCIIYDEAEYDLQLEFDGYGFDIDELEIISDEVFENFHELEKYWKKEHNSTSILESIKIFVTKKLFSFVVDMIEDYFELNELHSIYPEVLLFAKKLIGEEKK